jgi:hypothetical protein
MMGWLIFLLFIAGILSNPPTVWVLLFFIVGALSGFWLGRKVAWGELSLESEKLMAREQNASAFEDSLFNQLTAQRDYHHRLIRYADRLGLSLPSPTKPTNLKVVKDD